MVKGLVKVDVSDSLENGDWFEDIAERLDWCNMKGYCQSDNKNDLTLLRQAKYENGFLYLPYWLSEDDLDFFIANSFSMYEIHMNDFGEPFDRGFARSVHFGILNDCVDALKEYNSQPV